MKKALAVAVKFSIWQYEGEWERLPGDLVKFTTKAADGIL